MSHVMSRELERWLIASGLSVMSLLTFTCIFIVWKVVEHTEFIVPVLLIANAMLYMCIYMFIPVAVSCYIGIRILEAVPFGFEYKNVGSSSRCAYVPDDIQ